MNNPEPLPELKARIDKDGRFIMQEAVIVGIDVSKHTLDYTWTPGAKAQKCTNSKNGRADLVKKLLELQPKIVILEATGGYQTKLVESLHQARIPLKVVNPRQVRDFAKSLNRLGKTDAVDARTLAEFGASRALVPEVPKQPELVQLALLLRRRDQLQHMIMLERNYAEQSPPEFWPQLEAHCLFLTQQVKQLDKKIKEIAQSPAYAHADAIIQSIPGIGYLTSATLLAFMPELAVIGRKQSASLAGLAPFNRDSGKYRGQRHISGGRAQVRKALYCALRACLRFNPVVAHWFERFIGKGKPYKVAAVACIRKLLIVIRAMLISKTCWDAQRHELAA